ncbi:MAG TPA: hypothetical protein VHC44_09765 [Verrucomicrobiae bacterium]|nr:hypothetical protein [Verrucomicrobiae bacterium]
MKNQFGEDYPQAIVLEGLRIPLSSERRFSRSFYSKEHRQGAEISRFMDGSASITVVELKREWPRWSNEVRRDFCQSCYCLDGQVDFPEMLRYIMKHGDAENWSGVALSVAHQLPSDEAFRILAGALNKTPLGSCSNLAQAISKTKHADAEKTLRKHFEALWNHPALFDSDSFNNWIAFAATTCIAHLIELGVPASEFDARVRQLSEHACSGNRRSCSSFLSKHYSWLKQDTTNR